MRTTFEVSASRSSSFTARAYGTFDQGGNLWEWDEAIEGEFRVTRGGGFQSNAALLAAAFRADDTVPTDEYHNVGFRLAATIPEPGTGALLIMGLLGLARSRAS